MSTIIQNQFRGAETVPQRNVDAESIEFGDRSGLPIQTVNLRLMTLNEGFLLPWIAPAVRGLILKPLRDHFCTAMGGRELDRTTGLKDWRASPSTREISESEERNRHYCIGCRKNSDCRYGRVFEPDLNVIDARLIQRADTQGVRGISIASDIVGLDKSSPSPQNRTGVSIVGKEANERCPSSQRAKNTASCQVRVPANFEFSISLLALGARAIELLPLVSQAIDELGRLNGLGYKEPVHYMVNADRTSIDRWKLDTTSLSIDACGGFIPRVSFEFLSPLVIKECFVRGQLIPPTFHCIFRNAVRIVIRTIRELHDPSFMLEAKIGDFLEASRDVNTNGNSLTPFFQPSISHRNIPAKDSSDRHVASSASRTTTERDSGQPLSSRARSKSTPTQEYGERALRGWLGSITFKNVPASYLPWLYFAGKLGIGSDRNRGAGLWRLRLDT